MRCDSHGCSYSACSPTIATAIPAIDKGREQGNARDVRTIERLQHIRERHFSSHSRQVDRFPVRPNAGNHLRDAKRTDACGRMLVPGQLPPEYCSSVARASRAWIRDSRLYRSTRYCFSRSSGTVLPRSLKNRRLASY